MALRFKIRSAGVQGKSEWVLMAVDGKSETPIAVSPQHYRSIDNCKKGIKRFKDAVQVPYIEDAD